MDKRHVARVMIPAEIVKYALQQIGLPADAEILGAEWDFRCDGVIFWMEQPGLPEVEPNVQPSQHFPKFVRSEDVIANAEIPENYGHVEVSYSIDFAARGG